MYLHKYRDSSLIIIEGAAFTYHYYEAYNKCHDINFKFKSTYSQVIIKLQHTISVSFLCNWIPVRSPYI